MTEMRKNYKGKNTNPYAKPLANGEYDFDDMSMSLENQRKIVRRRNHLKRKKILNLKRKNLRKRMIHQCFNNIVVCALQNN